MDKDKLVDDSSTQKLLEIYKNIQLMRNKKMQLQIAIEAEKISRSYDAGQNLEEVTSRIEEISEKILEELSVKKSVEMAVQRIQMSDVIYRLLTDDEILTNGDMVLLQEHKKYIEEMLKRQTDFSSEIIQKTKEMEEIQNRMTKLRKESLILAARRKNLLAKVREIRQQKNEETSPWNSDMQQVVEKVHSTETTLKLIRPILQCLVVGSGVNWAQDEYLKEMVISLGRPLDELLQDKTTMPD